MIQLTRLNSHPLIVNSDLIKLIEMAPDTVLTLISGEKIVVLESSDQVIEKIIAYRREFLSGLGLMTAIPLVSTVAQQASHPSSDTKDQEHG